MAGLSLNRTRRSTEPTPSSVAQKFYVYKAVRGSSVSTRQPWRSPFSDIALVANLSFYPINMQLNVSLFLFTIITLVGWGLAAPISHGVHMEALSRPPEPYHDKILGLHARVNPDDLPKPLAVSGFPVWVRPPSKPSKWERVKNVMKKGKTWLINAKKKLGGREEEDELFRRGSEYEIWVRTYPSSEITTRDYDSLDIIG